MADYKFAEPSHSESNHIEDDIFNHNLLNEIINDNLDADPSIPDIEHSHTSTKKHRHRKKSKSSSNILLQSTTNNNQNKNNNNNNTKPTEEKYIRRRHSESSSESHSNEYLHGSRVRKKNKNTKNMYKPPMLIPLNVNRKTTKNQKKPSKISSPKSITSILSRYKSKKKHTDDPKSNGLGISAPVNVKHVIHVEWDDQRKAYKGIPDVWHSKIPQSYTVPTQELPVDFRQHRSVSYTQSVLHRAKSISIIDDKHNSPKTITGIDKVDIDYISQPGLPVPGPRVFIRSLHKKQANSTELIEMPDMEGDDGEDIVSICDYLDRIGIDLDGNKKMKINEIRWLFFNKMEFSRHRNKKCDLFVNGGIPRHLQQQILTYLDIRSYLRCCLSCSDLASFLDDPIIWKILVLYKSKVQGTLHKTNFRLRHRVWKATYMSMVKIDVNPSYYDYVWNIVVAGDMKSGQNRLVVSLGRHWRCKLTGLEPVISAVNGTYRFGVDFVIRRVIIRDLIIKLQVWDSGTSSVMADTSLLSSVNIFLILFDLTNKNSFETISNIARSMISLLPSQPSTDLKLMMVGNTTNEPQQRQISYDSAKRFANERGLMYIEANTDSEDNQSINNAFVNLAEECILFEKEKTALKNSFSNKHTNCSIQ